MGEGITQSRDNKDVKLKADSESSLTNKSQMIGPLGASTSQTSSRVPRARKKITNWEYKERSPKRKKRNLHKEN